MMQNINLYLPEFRKKTDWLPPLRMAQVAACVAVLLSVISVFEYWQTVGLKRDLAGLEGERAAALAATAALLDRYGAQTEDPVLLADIRVLEAGLQSKEALLQFLGERELGNSSGFSEYLADLSRFHLQGLSLTQVNLANGGRSVQLTGQVLRTALVPRYLQNLSKGSSFASKNFDTLQIREVPVVAGFGMPATWMFQVNSLNESADR